MESAICRGSAILGVGKSTAFWQRKGKCVAKFRKLPCLGVKTGIKIPTVEDTIVSTYGRYFGAGVHNGLAIAFRVTIQPLHYSPTGKIDLLA